VPAGSPAAPRGRWRITTVATPHGFDVGGQRDLLEVGDQDRAAGDDLEPAKPVVALMDHYHHPPRAGLQSAIDEQLITGVDAHAAQRIGADAEHEGGGRPLDEVPIQGVREAGGHLDRQSTPLHRTHVRQYG